MSLTAVFDKLSTYMNRSLKFSALILATFSLLFLIWSIGGMFQPSSRTPRDSSKPLVLVSVAPLAKMLSQIAEETIDIETVIPSHVDPHNWEPTYRDMGSLRDARLWFTVGMSFELPLEKKLMEANPDLHIYNVNTTLPTLKADHHAHHHGEEFDTHTWLSPTLDISICNFLTKILSELLPDHQTLYEKNAQLLISQLKRLNSSCKQSLEPFSGELLVTTHGAYSYYCQDFGLEQIVIEPSEGKEARMREITSLLKQLKSTKKQIALIVTQPQHTNKAADIIAKNLEKKTFSVDPYAPNYIETIERLTSLIVSERPPQGR